MRLRWTQEGFGRTSSTTSDQSTARNLMGFKDGTDNLPSDTPSFDRNVWVAKGDDPAWMRDGSYLVARRIRIRIEVWDRSVAGGPGADHRPGPRSSGAPSAGHDEFDELDLRAKGPDGEPMIPADSHVALAHQDANDIHILRRGYNFTDGLDPRVGQLDAGLFFLAYQRDPRTQFIPLQQKLAASDALNEYIQHVSSALFAVLPGVNRAVGSARPSSADHAAALCRVAGAGRRLPRHETARAIRSTRATSLVCISSSGRWTRAPWPGSTHSKRWRLGQAHPASRA